MTTFFYKCWLKSWSLSTAALVLQIFTSKHIVQPFTPWCFMKKRDGKAAFSTQSTKQLFIQCCFPHAAQRWAALTFTLRWLCAPPVIGGAATERSLYLCVCAGVTQPSTRICFPCSTKSPLLQAAAERRVGLCLGWNSWRFLRNHYKLWRKEDDKGLQGDRLCCYNPREQDNPDVCCLHYCCCLQTISNQLVYCLWDFKVLCTADGLMHLWSLWI